jgi:hypothetical protein
LISLVEGSFKKLASFRFVSLGNNGPIPGLGEASISLTRLKPASVNSLVLNFNHIAWRLVGLNEVSSPLTIIIEILKVR